MLAWKFRQQAERDLWGEAWQHTGHVFTMEDGAPVKPDYVTRLFEKLRRQAELPKITLHGARHEHASLWVAAGGDVTMLSKRLGHSTSRITADLYVSRVGDADRAQAEMVATMIPRARAHTVHTQDA
ncbi:tyrosine-type recombinase/integrase [Microbacterium sp. A8/3-1]|uniref:Tyrosine-type recombinase/integrase n=1 Tax=Microbacterium sp. A8/3-1 TaxID=3160749 RepID=A0AAU7VY00_9MICO